MKQVANMTGTIGRRRRFSVLAVTGNRNGLVGLSLSKAIDSKVAMRRSKERSIKKLRFIERFEDRTVYHDFQFRVNETMVFVERRPAGTCTVIFFHKIIFTVEVSLECSLIIISYSRSIR